MGIPPARMGISPTSSTRMRTDKFFPRSVVDLRIPAFSGIIHFKEFTP